MTVASILQAAQTFFSQAFPGQAGLVTLAAFALWIRKLCSGSSRFPITLPPQWLAVVSAGAGLLYGLAEALYQGQTVGQTIVAGLLAAAAGGFFDLFATAVYDHTALPKWVQTLLLLVDAGGQAGRGGLPPPPARLANEVVLRKDRSSGDTWPRGPFTARGHVLAMGLVVASLIAGPVAFLAAGASQQACIPAAAAPAIAKAADCTAVAIEDAGIMDPAAIVGACALDDVEAAGAFFVSLLADRKWAAAHPLAAARLRSMLDAGVGDAAPDVVTCVGSAPCFAGDPGYVPSPGVYDYPPRLDAAADWPPSTPQ